MNDERLRTPQPDSADDQETDATEDMNDLMLTGARDDESALPDGNLPGSDNIREGRVGGVIGGPHQQGGEGQGG